ncbi:MAG TPA: DsbC family protein [Thermomonas sp.]|nr:DsbC family protein [Thermomonas sp.]
MIRFLAFAALCGLSLSACAQQAAPQGAGQKITIGPQAAAEPIYAAGTPEARIREALRRLEPNITVERINPSPIPGFREVIATGQVVYVSEDGKYLFQGGLLDIEKRKDMSEAAMARLRVDILKTLPVEDRIVFAPAGKPKHTVVVLTDIECGYCQKFHSAIAEYTRRGIEVEYLAFPRGGLASADYRSMVSVWCAPDRRKALTDAKSGRAVTQRTCGRTPVDMQYRAGQRMGLTGTPMILNSNGELLGGYLTPDALLQRLEAKEPAAAGGA